MSPLIQALLSNNAVTATAAEAVDFDGTNDYLSRSTDLTGNADGKTFTFSCWLWRGEIGSNQAIYQSVDSQYGLYIYPNTSNTLSILGYNSSNTQILNATVTVPFQVGFTFFNILISIDMANTANRAVYINDVAATVTWTTYTNAAINFTCPNHTVGQSLKGRLSNVFLDYTYRDLSVTANRRLFVTADLKPAAGQAALNPILYLPMSDPTTVATNAGTGGNFTLTGTVARSGRGPNQYNAPYSTFDGSADYLSKTSGLTVPSTKVFTLQMAVKPTTPNSNADDIFYVQNSAVSQGINLRYFTYGGASNGFYLELKNSTGYIFVGYVAPFSTSNQNRNYILTLAIDMDNQSNCRAYLNGVAATMSISTFSAGQSLPILSKASIGVSTDFVGNFYNWYSGSLGALWFDTSYINLSVASNLAKFVSGTGIDAKPVDLGATGELPTGTSPLIYLPMYGNNAGKNYGTGGDFTVNSGPYTGARGPNEFWGNKAKFVNSYVGRSSSFGWGSTNKFTCSFWIDNITNASGQQNIFYLGDSGSAYFSARLDASNRVEFWAADSGGTMILSVRSNTAIATGASAYVQACFDLSDTAKRFIYINGANSLTSTTYTNTSTPSFNFARIGDNAFANYQLSEVYLLPDYIDFSVEANRLKFRDAFGNPTDLPSAITALSVTNPPIYMRFPPTAFGTNSGTGGAFTPTGTITDGGQL
jgi:hypothetical protein